MTNRDAREPTADGNQEVRILWSVLNFMDERAREGGTYISAKELREYVRLMTKTDDRRDDVLRILRLSQAIARTNNTGRANKQYYLTQIGKDLMLSYQRQLGG